MKQRDLFALEENLIDHFGQIELKFGDYRCRDEFKQLIWIVALAGLAMIFGFLVYLKGWELILSPIPLIPICFVFGTLFLVCNPWVRDYNGYLFEEHIAVNNNGVVTCVKYADIRGISVAQINRYYVPYFYLTISNGKSTFNIPPIDKNTLTKIRIKIATRKASSSDASDYLE